MVDKIYIHPSSYLCRKNMNWQERFNRMIWILNVIQTKGPISLSKINELWVRNPNNLNIPLNRQTFRSMRYDLEESFNIDIRVDNRNRYYIEDPRSLYIKNSQNQLLANINESTFLGRFKGLGSRVQVPYIPKGQEYLETIGESLQNNSTLMVRYRKYSDPPEGNIYEIEPYILKLHMRRWYIIGRKVTEQYLKTFSLDRILYLKSTSRIFIPQPTFDFDRYFFDYYGVFRGNEKPEYVLIRTTEISMKYLLDLNLHCSQELVSESVAQDMLLQSGASYIHRKKHCFYFRYYVAPTFDFANQLISLVENCEVLLPIWFRNNITHRVELMLSLLHNEM